MGHSHRQSVLLMYLWAALFSGTVVGLSVVRTGLVWLAVVTVVALAALLLVTVPQLRPWRARETRARPGVHAAPGSGAAGIPGGVPVPGPAPAPGLHFTSPVSADPPSSPFPSVPRVPPDPPAMSAWTEAVGPGRWAQVDQEAAGGAAPGAAGDGWPAAGVGYAPAEAVPEAAPDGFAADSDGVTGAFETGETAAACQADVATGTHDADEPAGTRDAGDPEPRWSLDDLPAPPNDPPNGASGCSAPP
jgi:hypothetical protein